VRTLSGWTLTTAAAIVFVLVLFGVLVSIHPITGFNTKSTAERRIPVFEAGDEEPAVNQSEEHTPKPVLLPASTEVPPSESIEMATDPQASEAVEFVLQKPFAEATGRPADPVVTAPGGSPSYVSPPRNTPAVPQAGSVQTPANPYTDETLPPVSAQNIPSDTPTITEETSPQYQEPLPPDLLVEAETPPQPPPVSSDETTTSPDLPADTSPFAEDTAYLE
jgi:hypothetical protein